MILKTILVISFSLTKMNNTRNIPFSLWIEHKSDSQFAYMNTIEYIPTRRHFVIMSENEIQLSDLHWMSI